MLRTLLHRATPTSAPPRGHEVAQLDGIAVDIKRIPVLRGADLVVRAGEVVGLVGTNGSGKSTLPRVLATLLPRRASAVMSSARRSGCWPT